MEVVEALAAVVAVVGGLWAVGQGVFKWGERRERARRNLAAEELEATKAKIEEAISGDVYHREVAPGDRALVDSSTGGTTVVSVINFKGGVGKSTLALNLGACFADVARARGAKKVLLIDLDYQGSLSFPLSQTSGENPQEALYSVFEREWRLETARAHLRRVNHTALGDCWYLPTNFALLGREERWKFDWALGNYQDDARFRLPRFIRSVQDMNFELVIIDCPPRLTLPTVSALIASTSIVAPVKLDLTSARSTEVLFQTLRGLKAKLWPNLAPLGVIGTLTVHSEANQNEAQNLRTAAALATQEWGSPIGAFDTTMPSRSPIATAAGATIAYFDQAGAGATRSPHDIFRVMGDEVAERLGIDR